MTSKIILFFYLVFVLIKEMSYFIYLFIYFADHVFHCILSGVFSNGSCQHSVTKTWIGKSHNRRPYFPKGKERRPYSDSSWCCWLWRSCLFTLYLVRLQAVEGDKGRIIQATWRNVSCEGSWTKGYCCCFTNKDRHTQQYNSIVMFIWFI